MELNPARFNALIGGMGLRASWRRGYACPCVEPTTGAPDPACRACRGLGRVWMPGVDVIVGKCSSKSTKAWADFGRWDDGDAVMNFGSDSAAYGIGPYDRLLMLDQSEPFSLNLTRGVNDRIAFSVISIEKVLAFDERRTLREFGLPDVNPSGELEWASGEPPAHQTYSITGRRHVEYFCNPDQPLDRPFHAGAALPRKVVLKRFELLLK